MKSSRDYWQEIDQGTQSPGGLSKLSFVKPKRNKEKVTKKKESKKEVKKEEEEK